MIGTYIVLLSVVALRPTSACFEAESILKAADERQVSIEEKVFNKQQDVYTTINSVDVKLPVPYNFRYIVAPVNIRNDSKWYTFGYEGLGDLDPCGLSDPSDSYSPGALFQLNRGFKAPLANGTQAEYTAEENNAQMFDKPCTELTSASQKFATYSFARRWVWSKTGPDTVNLTFSDNKQTTLCNGTLTQTLRRETVAFRVMIGRFLNATAQGCTASKGSGLCKPCNPSTEVRRDSIYNRRLSWCIPKVSACPIVGGFRGCSAGWRANGANPATTASQTPTLNCVPCSPGTYTQVKSFVQMYDAPGGLNRLFTECLPCPPERDTFTYASMTCWPCPDGSIMLSRTAPLVCRACSKGTYKPMVQPRWSSNSNICYDCPPGYYQDQEGRMTCKVCPTGWKCYPQLAISLTKFANTPYRWNGNDPECASLDGKTCWKDNPTSCTQKLQQIPALKAAGRLKAVACGQQHMQLWGIDGYSQKFHWCTPLLRELTPPDYPTPAQMPENPHYEVPAPLEGWKGAASVAQCKSV